MDDQSWPPLTYEVYPQNKFRLQTLPLQCCVMMVPMCAEFVGPLGRHGRHLQTTEHRLRIILCVYNVQENREACHMWNVVCNPFLERKKHDTGWHSSSTLWGVWRTYHEWFNGTEMGDTLMKDAKMYMMIRGAASCLWLMKIWCLQWKRWFKRTDDSQFRHFPCIFTNFMVTSSRNGVW
jgi:hypothetical protein